MATSEKVRRGNVYSATEVKSKHNLPYSAQASANIGETQLFVSRCKALVKIYNERKKDFGTRENRKFEKFERVRAVW